MFEDKASRFKRRHARHSDIEQDESGALFQRQFQGGCRVTGFGHDHEIERILQQTPHAIPHQFAVVGDHAANAFRVFRMKGLYLRG
jgi:hypothetical protein